MSQVFKIWKNGLNISFGAEMLHFMLLVVRERGREKEKEKSKLISPIYGVPLVEIRRVKNKSSSIQRGLRAGTKNTGFR